MKRKYSGFSVREAMELIPAEQFTRWQLDVPARQDSHDIDVYGIVSNGQTWQFYCLALTGEVFETEVYTTAFMPELLGALDYVCARCAANVL